ncbi:hypothetical protein P0E69_09390 [Chimaeribacter arupi]|uniref:hypothetical protein n=1 Tax=Chimaeribacter arupi TaxID=2060066 RepID=UPI002711FFD7|nr:hypothetical protein [Chimaeribacter arupi]WKZ94060.1 hypothetical protein P0E69_09390 [Chimaeribacter arupi]
MTDKQPAPVGDCHIVGKAVVPEFSELEGAAKRFQELMLNASMARTGRQQQALLIAMEAYRQVSTPSVILSLLRQNADLKAERDAMAAENAAVRVSGSGKPCKECGSKAQTWHATVIKNTSVQDGRLRMNEISGLFYLGCDECSETLLRVRADDVARLLTAASLRKGGEHG